MTWWIQLYLLLFVALLIAGLWDDCRSGRPLWSLWLAGLSCVVVVDLFVGRWQGSLIPEGTQLGKALYLMAVGWQLHEARLDLRQAGDDPDLTRGTIVLGTILSILFCLPAFVVAGISAFGS